MLRATAIVVVLGAVAALGVLVEPTGAQTAETGHVVPVRRVDAEGITYAHPVDAEIVDPFRPPPSPYGSGNRGVKYATEPGTEVRAAADGVVAFAGQVGGALHVTVAHADGRLTSYSGVAAIGVHRFERVRAGQPIALTHDLLHVGVREDGRYVDPEWLFGREVTGARLVPESPIGGDRWWTPGQEMVELRLVADELGPRRGGLGRLGRLAGRVGGWAGSLVERGTVALGATFDLARSGRELLVTHGPAALALAWHVAPYVLARSNPVVAGVVFFVVVPLLTGEVPPLLWFAGDLLTFYPRVIERTMEWWAHRQQCTPAHVQPPRQAERRIAVLVGGLDSTSEHAAIGRLRTGELGYADEDVIGFSYVGGRTPGTFDGRSGEVAPELAGLPTDDYSRHDSSRQLRGRGELLADLLTDVSELTSDAPIDLYAHSQGGLLAREALLVLERRPGGSEVLERLGLVATVATPHRGADLATLAEAVSQPLHTSIALRLAGTVTGSTLHPRSTNLTEMARGSDLLAELADGGLPPGPSYLSLGARGDLVVTEARTHLPGSRHVTLPGFGSSIHSDLVDQPATTRELALGLAGLPPTCEGLWELVGDLAVSELVQVGSSAVGLGISLTLMPVSPWDALEPLVRW